MDSVRRSLKQANETLRLNTQQARKDFGWDNAERFHRGSGPLSEF